MNLDWKEGGVGYYEAKDQIEKFGKQPFGEYHVPIESVMAGNYGGGWQELVKYKGNIYWMWIYGDSSANITLMGEDNEDTYLNIKQRLDKDEKNYSNQPAYCFKRFD